MIIVRTPQHPLFNYSECREMFDENRDKLDLDDFDTVIKNTHFFSYYDWTTGEFIGCIYFYQDNGRVYVTAYAGRKHHKKNLECFREALNYYTCDIYAERVQKPAVYCILKCGFERIGQGNDLFIYRRNKNGKKLINNNQHDKQHTDVCCKLADKSVLHDNNG